MSFAHRLARLRPPSIFSGCLGCISWPILIGVTGGMLWAVSPWLTTWWAWLLAIAGAISAGVVMAFAVMLGIAIHSKRAHFRANYPQSD